MINSGMNVNDILQKWPFLGKSVQLTSHFLKLTNVDIAVRLPSAVEVKADMLYEFFSSERQTNIELKHAVDKIGVMTMESHQYLHNGLFLLLMAYFRESTSSVVSFQQVWMLSYCCTCVLYFIAKYENTCVNKALLLSL